MIFAEIIYETGAKSVGQYANEAELLAAVSAHHERATKGLPANSGDRAAPAERIAKIELYSKHPNDLNQNQTVSTEVAVTELGAKVKDLDQDGIISVHELSAAIRDLSSPLVLTPESPHDSMYKMEADKVLTEGWAA